MVADQVAGFASSVVCEQPNTSECGEFAKCHAGYKIDA